jgi:hypothetical protein
MILNRSKKGQLPMQNFSQTTINQATTDATTQLSMYIREANLPHGVFELYKRGLIIQETGHFDTTTFEGGMKSSTRYIIFSSQQGEIKPSFSRYGCFTFDRGCFFKVLDVYTLHQRRLITLLHIPAETVSYFALHQHPTEEAIVMEAWQRFQKIQAIDPVPELTDAYWIKRTAFPIGITADGGYFFQFDYGNQQALNPLYEPKGLFHRLCQLIRRRVPGPDNNKSSRMYNRLPGQSQKD